ncbi:MAG: PP2C family protein-serine/threonine phosphatase, partial [Actinomycetota bacterium]
FDYGRVAVAGSVRLGTSEIPFRAGATDGSHQVVAERLQPDDRSACSGVDDHGRHWLACSLAEERAGVAGAVVVADLSEAELRFTDHEGLAHVAASARRALDSLAEYERQRMVALELQRDLLPDRHPQVAGLQLTARYQPGAFASRIGGDWYDVITSDDGDPVLVVGDMVGSGIRAAADMGRVRLLMQVSLQQGRSVPETFAQLNRFCAEEDLLATALAVTVDRSRQAATVVSAGHLPPVIGRPGGAEVMELAAGPPFGIGGDPPYREQPVPIDVDSTVLLFTDGLIERVDQPIDRSLRLLADRLAADRGDWAGLGDRLLAPRLAEQPSDDIALLAFRPQPPTEAGTRTRRES